MNLQKILQFLHEVEQLKKELRHSRLSDGRQESVAEHTWRMCFMALLLEPQMSQKPDMLKVLKMIVIHDINEAYVGDVPAFSQHHVHQKDHERQNMSVLLQRYPSDVMRDICDLREEFENQTSLESKFVKALDKIEVRIQHNEADISTWSDIEFPRALFSADQYCQFDDVVTQFNDLIKEESRQKIMNQSSKNIVDIEEEVKKLNQS